MCQHAWKQCTIRSSILFTNGMERGAIKQQLVGQHSVLTTEVSRVDYNKEFLY